MKPILVTGTHRSGSTWFGSIISLSNKVSYVHEPFNKDNICVDCGLKNNFWFEYVTKYNEKKYKKHINHIIEFKFDHFKRIKKLLFKKKGKKAFLRDYRNYFKYKFGARRVLIKDPIAFFSAEWLYNNYNIDVFILIRHPAAFVSSIKVKKWYFDFNNLLCQKKLMSDILKPFKNEIIDFSKNKKNIIDQGILLWRIFHHTILIYKEKYPNWYF